MNSYRYRSSWQTLVCPILATLYVRLLLVCYPLLQFTQSESAPDIMPRCSLAPLRLIGDQVNAGPRVYLFQGMSISLDVFFFCKFSQGSTKLHRQSRSPVLAPLARHTFPTPQLGCIHLILRREKQTRYSCSSHTGWKTRSLFELRRSKNSVLPGTRLFHGRCCCVAS